MSQYICHKHILKKGQDLENILMGSDEIGYFFENKESLKVLGYYASKDSKIDSPYSFFYQSFEGEHPEIINCSLILIQKGEDLWAYEKEGLKKTYQNSFAFLLDGERKQKIGNFPLNPSLKEYPPLESWKERVHAALEEIHSFESPI